MPTARAAGLLRSRPVPIYAPETDERALLELNSRPLFPAEFVRRPALVGRLMASGNVALALVIAPPGYGKTSLLSEWADCDQRPFVWLGFGATDAVADLDDVLAELLSPHVIDGHGLVAVLDDAHAVPADTLRVVIEALFRALPSGSIVAVASRTEPVLPTGRLRAHRMVIEIRHGDLALGLPEAALLVRQSGSELSLAVVEQLVERTEGWPAALYLASLSLLERNDAPGSAAPFRGDHHLVMEYLRDEVLSVLPPELTGFLARSSILDELSGPVCDVVLQLPGSAQRLAALGRTTQLLEPIDPARHRYRWHPLFRDCMLGELRRLEPELEPELHLRASVFHAEHGNIEAAIDHACAARDAERAGELLAGSIAAHLAGGRSDQVRRWVGAFSREQIAASGTLAMCAAHGCLTAGDLIDSQHWASTAAASVQRGGTDVQLRLIEAGLAVLEAATARMGVGGIDRATARAYGLEPEGSQWRPICVYLNGVAEHLAGDSVVAARTLESAADLGGSEAPGLGVLCLAQRAMIAIEQHDWTLAEELVDRAGDTIIEHRLDHDPMSALVYAAMAAVRAKQGRVDEAKRDLRQGIELMALLGDFLAWYGAQASLLLAHAALWLADIVGARTLLAQASRLARKVPDAVIFERWFTEAWAHMDTLAETSLAGPSSLTIAELRVLRFLPSYRSFREIAELLGVSANTVKSQAHAVYRKLGAASRSEAVARASEAGLLGQ